MRSLFRYSLLGFCAAALAIGVMLLSSPRFERKANAAFSTKLKISQFRENGPGTTGSCGTTADGRTAFCNGRKDEFIEIYNNTDSNYGVGSCSGVATPCTTDTVFQGGIGVFASSGNGTTDPTVTEVCFIPTGTVIPPRGYALCTNRQISPNTLPSGSPGFVGGANSAAYSLNTLGAIGSTTSSRPPASGSPGNAATPGDIAFGGGGSVGNFPIINGRCADPKCGTPGDASARPGAFNEPDIPNDAGLLLCNIGNNTVSNSGDVSNTNDGFAASGVDSPSFLIFDRVGFAPYGGGAQFQPTAGANPQDPFFGQFPFTSCQISSGNCGPNGNSRPLFASAFCDGNTDPTNLNDASCMRPVGDASNIIHGSQTFYGDAGEYALLRRMTTFASGQTIPRDTDVNSDDFALVAPRPGLNMGVDITSFAQGPGPAAGLVSVLGAAFPHNLSAPIDALDSSILGGGVFDPNKTILQGPNAERRWAIDNSFGGGQDFNNTITANNPLGSLILRFSFTYNGPDPFLNYLRFSIDNAPVPCGAGAPSPGAVTPGSGNARNLQQANPNFPNKCTGSDAFTAVLKLLNMPTEQVAQGDTSSGTSRRVRGTVIEDISNTPTPAAPVPGAPGTWMAPNGGGINNKLVMTTNDPVGSLTGQFGNLGIAGIGSGATPSVGSGGVFFVAFRLGVVKSGKATFLVMPEGTPATPTPTPLVLQ